MMRVLLVEDEALLAIDLADLLTEAGFEVIGPAMRAAEALALIASSGCDAAVLDVHLGDETSEPVAIELTRLGVPFIVLSGYNSDQHPPAFKGAPMLLKPVRFEKLATELRQLARRT